MRASSPQPPNEALPTWQVVAGLCAILLVAQKLLHDWPLGLASNSVWACHVGNLFLGVGLLSCQPWLARLGVYWVVLGVPFWIIDVITLQSTTWSSVLSHLGGVSIASFIVSGRSWRGQRHDPWVAWLGFLALQLLSFWLTPAALNVNIAHAVHPSAQSIFSNHFVYLVFLAFAAAVLFHALHHSIESMRRRRRQIK